MTRRVGCLLAGWVFLGLIALAPAVQAAGIDDFTLTRAIPADAMLAVHARNHDGMSFVNAQYTRVWKAFEKQSFDKDVRRLIRDLLKDNGGDVEAFDQQWQQLTDLAAGVQWTGLAEREFAFAMKVAPPFGADFVYLFLPKAEQVAGDFDGLTAIIKNIAALAPEMLVVTSEGEGESVVHVLALAQPVVPIKLTAARHKDVILLGIGTSMADQSLALLRGEGASANATLASTERFKQAFAKLSAPKDQLFFVDIGALVGQGREFAKMGAAAASAQMAATSAPAEGEAAPMSLDFLPKIVDAIDLWDFAAAVTATDGMQTKGEEITVLRTDAKSRPLYRVFYGGGALKSPLKYIPAIATDVSVMSGFDLLALYQETLKFIKTEVPGGEGLAAQWEEMKSALPMDVEKGILGWIGTSFATFSAPIPTPFLPGWVWIIEVRDEAQANAALEQLSGFLDGLLVEQQGGVEDAKLEGAEGFKRVILPPMFAMVPGLGRPIFGVKDGYLFIGNGPEIVSAALAAGAGTADNFAKNERFKAEGLPLSGEVCSFAFQDLSKLGEQLGQMLPAMAFGMRMMPNVAENPVLVAVLNVLTKVGTVCKELDFYKSSCTVTTFDGRALHSKTVVNYQEPPKPKSTTVNPSAGGQPATTEGGSTGT